MKEEGLSLKEALRLQLRSKNVLGVPTERNRLQYFKWRVAGIRHSKIARSGANCLRKDRERIQSHAERISGERIELALFFSIRSNLVLYLADDMGLGKTIQVLAFLNILKKTGKPNKTSLLIIPASLISHWVDGVRRFSPDLRFLVAHPGINSTSLVESVK